MIQEHHPGQTPEEAYFYTLNRELIERMRRDLDAKKADVARQPSHSHWMKCPKCGSELVEVALMGIHVDKCAGCQGIYFDSGELQILLESQEPKGFLGVLKKMF